MKRLVQYKMSIGPISSIKIAADTWVGSSMKSWTACIHRDDPKTQESSNTTYFNLTKSSVARLRRAQDKLMAE